MTEQAQQPTQALATRPPAAGELRSVDVFVAGTGGGNPVPLVADARGLSTADMQAIARATGHESAFVLPASEPGVDWRLRFFVPQHEMEMCGHATVGSLWALRQWGRWTSASARIATLSGIVDTLWDAVTQRVWISQPAVQVEALSPAECERVAAVLGLPPDLPVPAMVNASTSRAKTLVPLPDRALLHALHPDFAAMEHLCESIGSTGLYPYAPRDADASEAHAGSHIGGHIGAHVGGPVFTARQFPKASGYPEDAATGIAAAALWGQLARCGAIGTGSAGKPVTCTVRQGEAMGRPSAIAVRARFDAEGQLAGCWISGDVCWSQ